MISVVVTCSVTVLVGERVSVVLMTSVITSVTLLITVSVCNGPRIEVDVVVVDVTVVETTVVTGAEVIKQEHAVLMKLLAYFAMPGGGGGGGGNAGGPLFLAKRLYKRVDWMTVGFGKVVKLVLVTVVVRMFVAVVVVCTSGAVDNIRIC